MLTNKVVNKAIRRAVHNASAVTSSQQTVSNAEPSFAHAKVCHVLC